MKQGTPSVPMIDTSYWNLYDPDNANLAKAKFVGIRVNMIRLGKGNPAVDVDHGIDRSVVANYAKTVEQGIKPLFYWRIYDIYTEPAEVQAERLYESWNSLAPQTSGPLVINDEETEKAGDPTLPKWASYKWRVEFRATLMKMGFSNLGVATRQTWWDPSVSLPWGDLPLFVAHWVPAEVRDQTPADTRKWDEFAFLHLNSGPWLPSAWGRAAAWQFSADGNTLGQTYGFNSEAIDCNLLDQDLYEHWFGKL